MMFDKSPDHACGPFRTQCQLPAAAVFKGVHFFLNHIGLRPKRPLKEIQGFKGGGADFLETKAGKPMARVSFQLLEKDRLWRQDIMRAANRLIFWHRGKLYNLPFI